MSIDEYASVSRALAGCTRALAKCHCTLLSTVEVTEEEEKALLSGLYKTSTFIEKVPGDLLLFDEIFIKCLSILVKI